MATSKKKLKNYSEKSMQFANNELAVVASVKKYGVPRIPFFIKKN